MTYYECYLVRCLASNENARAAAKEHWLNCFVQNATRYGWDADGTKHAAMALAIISVAENVMSYRKEHSTV